MPDIVLQFSAQRNVPSTIINWFTAGDLAHVDAVLPNGLLFGARINRMGGKPPGVWDRPPNYGVFTRVVRMTIPVTNVEFDAFYGFLEAQRGKPYDWRAVLGFAIERDWRSDDAWICSELIAAALEKADTIIPKLYLSDNKIVPVALALVVSGIHGRVIDE